MGYEAIEDKLRWTRHHFNILNRAATDYVDPENTGFFVEDYDETKKEAWGRFDPLNGMTTTHLSHIFGDVIQSAHSCLDYLVCELFSSHNNGEPGKSCHKFPIVNKHALLNKEIGDGALFGIPFEAVAVIESLQPYEGRTDSVGPSLQTLRTLTNHHKHRKVRVAVLTANRPPSDPAATFEVDGETYAFVKDLPRPEHFEIKIGPFPVVK